jgi:hypothetical protein
VIVSDLQAQRESGHVAISADQGQVAISSSPAAEIGEALSDASQIDARGRNFTRSRSLSQTRNKSSNESIIAFMPTPRSRSANTEEGTSLISSKTRSNLETEKKDSWSSEFEEDVTPKPPSLTGDRRNRVEQAMETFWDLMNKSWKYRIYEMTRNSGEAGASSITNESASQTTSAASSHLIPSQKKSSRDQPVESRWAEIYLLLFRNDDPDNIPSLCE